MPRWSRFRRLFGLEPAADVDAELHFHVEMRVRELIEQGETPERARQLALQRFGDYERARIECVAIGERRKRHMQRTEFITELRQDIGYAFRMLRRTPAFTLAALVTLALGIGANSAIFSVVHGVLLESLPYRDAGRLHHLQMLYPDGTKYSSLSAPDFMSVRQDSRVFEQIEAFDVANLTWTGTGEPQEVNGAVVTVGLFDLLGFEMPVGRAFRADENRPGAGGVIILSHGFWQRAFGGDRNVVGRTLILSGRPYTVIGVLAEGAQLPYPAELFAPIEFDNTFDATTQTGRRSEFLAALARARAGVTAEQIEADVRRIGAQLQTSFPQTNGALTFTSTPLQTMIVGDVRRPLLVLLGAVGFVLLVACANVANLLLARGSARQGELAVRAALGAGRPRLVRQLITEAMVLGLAGGVLGLAVAYWSTGALIAARPADLPRLDEIGLDGTVVLFTLGAALLTGLVFGMVPALQATNEHLLRGLQESSRGGAGGRRTHRMRSALVVAEMALAVILLTGSGLLIRSFIELTRVNPGFQPEGAIAVRVTLQGDLYKNGDQVRNRVGEIEDRLRGLPGVVAVGAGSVLPLGGLGSLNDFSVEGAPPPPPNVNAEIAVASVTPDYFKAIGTALQRGRLFGTLDHAKSPPVALLNEAAVRQWFPDQDPIGKRVLAAGAVSREVVGIVRDVLQRNPGEPAAPQMFLPYTQRTSRTLRVIVRAQGDPLALAPAVRDQIRTLDPNLPLADVVPLQEMIARSIARPRFYTSLLTLFAAVALALSATGIFGVMSYTVAQQSKEIGIRIALGARTTDVLRGVVGRALVLAGIGVGVGLIIALALGRVIRTQLFGVSVFDPVTVVSVIAVLITSAALASLLPARRAATVDPMAAFLTQERELGEGWLYERKFDGIRLLAYKRGNSVELYSRNRLRQHLPGIEAAIKTLPVTNAILDGEVAWDRSSGYHVFDILWLDDRSTTAWPIEERRALLKSLPFTAPLRRVSLLSDDQPWERARREGWEGVIAKRRGSPYEHRRSKLWLKLKVECSQELVVGGFTDPQGARVGLGALLVGYYEGDDFVFAGKIGTGFDTKLLLDLRKRLDKLEVPASPFTRAVGLPRLRAHWVRPKIVVQVSFIEWTVHGKLRHPRLIGVRFDKNARQVIREQ